MQLKTKEEGDARESLERNSIECPNFLFSPTSDHTSPGQGEAGKSNRQEIFGIKGAFKHEGPLPTLTASAARDATQLRSRGAAKPRTFRMGDSKRHQERSTAATRKALSNARLARTLPHHLPSPLSPLNI